MDETPLNVVAEEGQGTKSGFLWVYRARIGHLGHPATIEMVLMEFHFSRAKAIPCGILRDFLGTLQTDGYAGYDEVFKNLGFLRAGCSSQCRRPRKAAEDHGSVEATKMIGLMQGLWRLERAIRKWIRKKGLNPNQARELIRRARAKTSTRIVARIAGYKAELLQDRPFCRSPISAKP